MRSKVFYAKCTLDKYSRIKNGSAEADPFFFEISRWIHAR